MENITQTQFDSRQETEAHINKVQSYMMEILVLLELRAVRHDRSKLRSPEKECFDKVTGRLRGLTYGSKEYQESLEELKPALEHHYKNNSHHPEYYSNGINGMTLLDLIEMFCDWKAAGERHADGSIERSLRINKDRFQISDQLQAILKNTAKELEWIN